VNSYQKIGVFVIRVVSTIILGAGLMGFIHAAVGAYEPLHFRAAIAWSIAGAVFFALADPVGRFIGRGLD
jgi:hypothetical protein